MTFKKKSKSLLFIKLTPLLCLSILCGTDTEITSPSKNPPSGNFTTHSYSFTTNKDTITLNSNSSCQYTQGAINLLVEGSKYRFKIVNDTMIWSTLLRSKSVLSYVYLKFSRLSGNDNEGKWLVDSCWHEIKYGVTKSDTLQAYLQFLAYKIQNYSWIEIKNKYLTFYTEPGSDDFTYRLLSIWEIDSLFANYKIQVDSINKQKIRLIGKRLSDTVSIEKVNDSIISFVSNNPSCPAFAFNTASLCLAEFYPSWFTNTFLKKNSLDPGLTHPTGDFDRSAFPYFKKGTKAIEIYTTDCECIRDSLVKKNIYQKGTYFFNEDSLHLKIFYPESSFSACTTNIFLDFSRLSGLSFIGKYLFSSCSYNITGTATSRDSGNAQSLFLRYKNGNYVWLEISDTFMTLYRIKPEINQFTSSNKDQWEKMNYSVSYDIVFDSITPLSFRLIGNIKHDTVNVRKSDYYITHYNYSDTKYPEYIYRDDGTMCPKNAVPVWIGEVFFTRNKKALN